MLTLLEASFTVLVMPLAQGSVVRCVDCTFHTPTTFTVVYTLLCQYCHLLVGHLLCEKNYVWPGPVSILQFTFG